ncbi:AbrB/MazE/SpoVT family DNA-binding domain-containing protein [Hoyosella subflava]|uniref:Transcriptional regulator, AbrB family n=1 Tax=Hoyosella subflava (strain DSM 45089 / JCM 17490 / NBRC 109087 / DQS3-9A1) TaxID=443218 RepID=F6ERK7_HOYSD|nr:AbrB/MazE/SpoVT family DNA-binding domain-containing protein [Hoyosella subflava]AEF38527.1 Transcriptional regulator, AbrB family [Hoyosella subflava DQS3-9A1]
MRLNSKGHVTIPAELRRKYALEEGDQLEVVEVGNALQTVRRKGARRRGKRLIQHMRGRATTTMSTDELMELFRGE